MMKTSFSFFRCPACFASLTHVPDKCVCGFLFRNVDGIVNFCNETSLVNAKTQETYEVYSKHYAPVALLAYWIVWRGNIFKHIQFFKHMTSISSCIVDIATGDGSLSKVALNPSRKTPGDYVFVDISKSMLKIAMKKIRYDDAMFVQGDVMNLPFQDSSVPAISCFGGFNSFPSGSLAMKELKRVLKTQGLIRGSVLLEPKAKWRKKLIRHWIHKGYQTDIISRGKFDTWVREAKLEYSYAEQYGDVLLFELKASP